MPESAPAGLMVAGSLPAEARLRSLTWEDGAAVAWLAGQLGGSGEPDHWRRRMEPAGNGRPRCWGIEVGGELVAHLLGHVKQDEFGVQGEVAWLEVLVVHPARQGHGLARVLAEALLEDCAKQGIPRVLTLVSMRDQPLRCFFRALGFRQSQLLCVERRV